MECFKIIFSFGIKHCSVFSLSFYFISPLLHLKTLPKRLNSSHYGKKTKTNKQTKKKPRKQKANKNLRQPIGLFLFVFLATFLEFPVLLPSRLVFSGPEKHCLASSYEFLLLPLPPPLIPYSHSWVNHCVEWTTSAINS